MNKKIKQKSLIRVALLTIGILCLIYVFFWQIQFNNKPLIPPAEITSLRQSDFSTKITNPYFTLKPGSKFVYETHLREGLERIEIEITGETKTIAGIHTLIYHDKSWINGIIEEDTRDYLAQYKNGDLWYFGEDVDNYKNGVFTNHEGSWMSGVNGGKPGIWVKAHPKVGETYAQEYLPGEAEDMVTIQSLHETITIPYGTFTNCLKTFDWTPLNPADLEHKYYCPQVGITVLEDDQGEKTQLVSTH